MATFSERLKQALQMKQLSASELSKLTSIPKSAISQYLSNAFKPKQTRIYVLAQALNVSEAWLMGFDVPMERQSPSFSAKNYESDYIYKLPITVLEPLARALECSPEYLMDWEDKPIITLSKKEEKVITQYRQNPSMQKAVDTLLGIED